MSKQIEAHTLRDWLDTQHAVTVLDIGTDDDYAQWAIPDSLHVNAYEALRNGQPGALADLAFPSDRPVVTVCNAGQVSQTAADVLATRGFDARSFARLPGRDQDRGARGLQRQRHLGRGAGAHAAYAHHVAAEHVDEIARLAQAGDDPDVRVGRGRRRGTVWQDTDREAVPPSRAGKRGAHHPDGAAAGERNPPTLGDAIAEMLRLRAVLIGRPFARPHDPDDDSCHGGILRLGRHANVAAC